MKEIVKEYTIQGTRYVAEDGKEFATRKECEAYEKAIRHKAIRQHIMRRRLWLNGDVTREEGIQEMWVVLLRDAAEWEAWTGRPVRGTVDFPLTGCSWEELVDKGPVDEFETRVADAQELVKVWKEHLASLEYAIAEVKERAAEEDAR